MGTVTHIQWTDHTFNPWEGCTKVSPGCAHCYAEARDIRFTGGKHWGKGAPRRRTSEHNWNDPRRWNKAAEERSQLFGNIPWARAAMDASTHRPRVFCASLADWLDDEVPIEWLADLLDLIRETPNLDWQLLTKRPELWRDRMAAALEWCRCGPLTKYGVLAPWLNDWLNGTPPANVWIGTTVEDQQRADERIPHLLRIPAKIRFLSCEPLLGPVDLLIDGECSSWKCPACGSASVDNDQDSEDGKFWTCPHCKESDEGEADWKSDIHWVICGGESGKDARPMNPDWARSLRAQCAAAGVAFFFKQWGEWVRDADISHAAIMAGVNVESRLVEYGDDDPTNFRRVYRVGKVRAGRKLDGIEHNFFPDRM